MAHAAALDRSALIISALAADRYGIALCRYGSAVMVAITLAVELCISVSAILLERRHMGTDVA